MAKMNNLTSKKEMDTAKQNLFDLVKFCNH